MLGLRHLLRSSIRQSSLTAQLKQFSLSSTVRNSSDDEDNPTDRKPKSKTEEKQKKAINKLNTLLSTMVEEDKTQAQTKKQAVLSRPKRIPKKGLPERKPVVESKVEAAAKSAAASLGGDVAKTESDLLSRLRSQASAGRSWANPEPIVERSEESRRETARSLTSLLSAMEVEKKPIKKTEESFRGTRAMGGEERQPWRERQERERGQQRGEWRGRPEGERGPQGEWKERSERERGQQRGEWRGRPEGERGPQREWKERSEREHGQQRGEWRERRGESERYERRPRMEPERVVLFGNESLNIFKDDFKPTSVPKLETWQRCLDREIRLASTHPPANHFEEMIQWTEQGKLWRFPIDNEQDMLSEKATSFTEHVFFDSALEGWCTSPEVRHFMDLVCVGLSKNPYITAQEKLAHIEWFRNYFADKAHLIDMLSEKATSFTEHVFFDSALEGWCTSPEVRHFMDLVCVGLSKNPYITAQEKLAHIEWFRNYFADKAHLIDGGSQQTEQQSISQ